MGISLKPEHLRRYRDIAVLLAKYGRPDFLQQAGFEEDLLAAKSYTEEKASKAEALAADLEALGPTFIKMGQLLSTRPDLLPISYVKALARLQDRVKPLPYDQIESAFRQELGVRISKAFAEFDSIPLAAASLGQVHRAKTREGKLVAIKIQRPGMREQVAEDLESLAEIAEFLDRHTELGEKYHFEEILEEFRRSFVREFDYRQEARNLIIIHNNLRDFDRIVVPFPIDDFTTSRVLTMEYVSGRKITNLNPIVRTELDGAELVNQLFNAYLQQILIDGIFHADPHPGNLFLTDDHRIALLDLGMVGRTLPSLQESLLHLLHAMSEGRAEDAAIAATRMGHRAADFDPLCFRREVRDLVSQNQDVTLGDLDMGTLLLELVRACGLCGLRLPSELTMLAKTLLNLDQVGKALHPDFNPAEVIRNNAVGILRHRALKSLSADNIVRSIVEFKNLVEHLPRRVEDFLDKVQNNELQVNVNAIDENKLLAGIQKIANRITLGLILAALLLSASNLVTIPSSFTILGYPGLAFILLMAAAGGGIMLIVSILLHDERSPK